MYKSLQDFFSQKFSKSENKTIDDAQELKLAAATLMFEVARADGNIEHSELEVMGSVLQKQFSIADEDIATMISLAENSSEQSISLQGFTRRVCDNWDNAKRVKLIEHLWLIALADDNIDSHERHLVRKIASLLYLTENQIIVAKQNASKASLR